MAGVGAKVNPLIDQCCLSDIVAQISFHFLCIHVTLAIIQPRKTQHHVEEINLPIVESHDIIVVTNDVGVEVIHSVEFPTTHIQYSI